MNATQKAAARRANTLLAKAHRLQQEAARAMADAREALIDAGFSREARQDVQEAIESASKTCVKTAACL